jgi:hypothetical protein
MELVSAFGLHWARRIADHDPHSNRPGLLQGLRLLAEDAQLEIKRGSYCEEDRTKIDNSRSEWGAQESRPSGCEATSRPSNMKGQCVQIETMMAI